MLSRSTKNPDTRVSLVSRARPSPVSTTCIGSVLHNYCSAVNKKMTGRLLCYVLRHSRHAPTLSPRPCARPVPSIAEPEKFPFKVTTVESFHGLMTGVRGETRERWGRPSAPRTPRLPEGGGGRGTTEAGLKRKSVVAG